MKLTRCALAYHLHRLPRVAWQAVSEWRALHVSKRSEWGTFLFLDYDIHDPIRPNLEKVIAALELVETVDPRRYRRIRKEMPRILVRRGGGARFLVLSRTCVLDAAEIEHESVAVIAMTIVHEATHARLNASGFYPWHGVRARLERRCIREERAFVLKLRELGFRGVDRVLQWLDECLSSGS